MVQGELSEVRWLKIGNDVSEMGLRRVHVIVDPKLKDEALRWVKDEVEGEDMRWEFCELAVLPDEIGNVHLYLYWRWSMGKMFVVCDRDVTTATRLAAGRYEKKMGVWPDRAVVREGTELPAQAIKIVDEKGDEQGMVRFEEVKWMRRGDVGVYRAGME